MKLKGCRNHGIYTLWCFACNRIGAPPSLRACRRVFGIKKEIRHVPGQLPLFSMLPDNVIEMERAS